MEDVDQASHRDIVVDKSIKGITRMLNISQVNKHCVVIDRHQLAGCWVCQYFERGVTMSRCIDTREARNHSKVVVACERAFGGNQIRSKRGDERRGGKDLKTRKRREMQARHAHRS